MKASCRFIVFVFLIPSFLYSQDRQAISLEELLIELAEQYQVRFSYVDETIQGKQIAKDLNSLSFEELLYELEKSTRLRFEIIDDDYVIVRKFRSDDLVSICGHMVNSAGESLIGVTIGYANAKGTFSGDDGYFQLDSIPYSSRLTFRYLGYLTESHNVSNLPFDECVKIILGETVSLLEEVVVQDYLAAGISKDKNSIRISPKEFKTLPGLVEPDILQSLQQVPGVNSPFETAAGLYVRGGLPDQNLILWNGIKTYNQGHFFGMISTFNPYITEKVDFIKNGTSAQFGGRVSSVIDITSRTQPATYISGGVGTNMIHSDAYLDIPIISDKLSIQFSGRRSFSDLVETITYNQMADRVFQNTKIDELQQSENQANNKFFFNDYTTNVMWKIDDNNLLKFNSLYSKDDLDFSTENSLSNQSFNDRLLHANEGYILEWNKNNDRFSLDMNTSYSKYILKYEFVTTATDTTTLFSKKNLVTDFNYQLNSSFSLNENHTLFMGYEYSNNNIQYAYETSAPSYSIVLDADNTTLSTHAFYTEYEFNNDNILIRPGLRINRYEELDELFLEPRLYVEKRLNGQFTLSTSGEYRTQVASQIKESVVSDLSLENKVWALASEDRFPVIKSYQFTLGGSYKNEGWFIDLEGYRKQVLDVTTLTFGFLNPEDNQFRVGDSRIMGSDFFLKKVWPNYESWISYSYIRTENTFNDLNDNQPFPGSWNIEHTVRFNHVLNLNQWEFSLGWTWHSGKSFTDVAESPDSEGPVQIAFTAINANNLPNYHRLDLSAMYEWTSKKASNIRYRAGLSILNLYNQENLLNREFRTTPSLDNELIDTRVYSLGITPNLVFRVFW